MNRISLPLLVCAFILSGCSLMPDWIGAEREKKMEGERMEVLPDKSDLRADQSLQNVNVVLPPVAVNTIWLNSNFGQTYHLALKVPFSEDKTEDVGDEPNQEAQRIDANPVIAKDIIYVLDGGGTLSARPVGDISESIWEADLRSETFSDGFFGLSKGVEKEKFLGGHISYDEDKIFVTTAVGDVVALDARRGYEIWRRSFNLPIRSAPVADSGVVYLITVNNQLYAVDANTGKTNWTHAGITETTGVLGAPSPVVSGGYVLAPYSSGELYVLRKDNGAMVWADSMAALNLHSTSLFSLNDIDASPVVYEGVVYAVGHEGVLTATELTTSKRIWEQEISSIKTPWIVGDFIFLLSTNDELICIYRPDGRIKWIAPLPSYQNPKQHKDKITWNGPVVAGNVVFAVNSIGELYELSPQTGEVIGVQEVEENIFLPPIVVDKKMYLLNNSSELTILN